MQGEPNKNPQNILCLGQGCLFTIRQYIGAGIYPVVHAFPLVICRVLPIVKVIAY
jgi:hypothetical protein